MTIIELLEAHELVITGSTDTGPEDWGAECMCGGWEGDYDDEDYADHRAHVAEVLEAHMQEREAEAWQAGYEDGSVHAVGIRAHIDGLTGSDPKRPANPYRKKSSDGR